MSGRTIFLATKRANDKFETEASEEIDQKLRVINAPNITERDLDLARDMVLDLTASPDDLLEPVMAIRNYYLQGKSNYNPNILICGLLNQIRRFGYITSNLHPTNSEYASYVNCLNELLWAASWCTNKGVVEDFDLAVQALNSAQVRDPRVQTNRLFLCNNCLVDLHEAAARIRFFTNSGALNVFDSVADLTPSALQSLDGRVYIKNLLWFVQKNAQFLPPRRRVEIALRIRDLLVNILELPAYDFLRQRHFVVALLQYMRKTVDLFRENVASSALVEILQYTRSPNAAIALEAAGYVQDVLLMLSPTQTAGLFLDDAVHFPIVLLTKSQNLKLQRAGFRLFAMVSSGVRLDPDLDADSQNLAVVNQMLNVQLRDPENIPGIADFLTYQDLLTKNPDFVQRLLDNLETAAPYWMPYIASLLAENPPAIDKWANDLINILELTQTFDFPWEEIIRASQHILRAIEACADWSTAAQDFIMALKE